MALELLLADGESCRPVLHRGIAEEALLGVAPPPRGALPERLWDVNSEPHDLSKQRWGVVAPRGPEGDRLLALIEPLRRVRQQAQGAPVEEYRLPPPSPQSEEVGAWAMRWKKEVFRRESTAEAKLPRYLLLLGDLEQIPLEVQQVLSTDAFVGRLSFPSDAGYEAYVTKVLHWEEEPAREQRARMLFFTSRDGSEATNSGYHGLIAPNVSSCRTGQPLGAFPPADILELGEQEPASLEQLLAGAAEPRPGVLFSLSHGASGSAKDRRERQGALLLPGGKLLTGADVASRPFLPGGIWFFFACFSAGTPVRSSYAHWLQRLQAFEPAAAQAISATLLAEGEKPFIAALPQAALANPEGPLAVMGHVDLAWSCSFKDRGRPTPSRFLGVLKALAEGGRAGVALSALQRFANETSIELALLYNQEAAKPQGAPSTLDPVRWAELWMQRQDLSNYILLGDPAVRLRLVEPAVEATPQQDTAWGLPGFEQSVQSPRDPSAAAAAVLALLAGGSPETIAARQGVTLDELRQWEELYREAGNAALARHFSERSRDSSGDSSR